MHPQRDICVGNKLIHERGQSGAATRENEKITKKVMRRGNAGEKVAPGTEVGKSSPADWPKAGVKLASTDTRRRREDSQPIPEKNSKLHKFVKWPQPWGGNRLAALDPLGWLRVDSLINYGDATRLARRRSAGLTAQESQAHC